MSQITHWYQVEGQYATLIYFNAYGMYISKKNCDGLVQNVAKQRKSVPFMSPEERKSKLAAKIVLLRK